MIRFPTTIKNDTAVVELPPSSTARRHTRALIAVVESLFLRGFARIVLDLRCTARLPSAPVQAIAFLHASARSRGCVLQLDNVSAQAQGDLQRVAPSHLPTIVLRPEPPKTTPRPRRWERARTVRPQRDWALESRAARAS